MYTVNQRRELPERRRRFEARCLFAVFSVELRPADPIRDLHSVFNRTRHGQREDGSLWPRLAAKIVHFES